MPKEYIAHLPPQLLNFERNRDFENVLSSYGSICFIKNWKHRTRKICEALILPEKCTHNVSYDGRCPYYCLTHSVEYLTTIILCWIIRVHMFSSFSQNVKGPFLFKKWCAHHSQNRSSHTRVDFSRNQDC